MRNCGKRQGKGWQSAGLSGVGVPGASLPGLILLILALIASRTAGAQAVALTFAGTTAVGTTSSPVTVTLTVHASGTGSPAALTSGTPGLDFAIADPGTCATGLPLVPGGSCHVGVVFQPRYPGLRQGAVVIQSGNTLIASAPLSGLGQGGLPVLVPGEINTVAGNGQWVYHGDGVAATAAPIFLPTGLALDGAGNLFFSDSSNNRVRRVDAVAGTISTVAGTGTAGSQGDGGAAANAQLNNPSGLSLDGAGNLYIADSGNNLIRRVDAVTQVISTVAGKASGSGWTGDGGAATNATLTSPQGIALTLGGDLLIADTGDNVVRLVTFADGKIQTIAGTGVAGYNADGILATGAQLSSPWGVAVRTDGAVAIADFGNERVRLVDGSGKISTVAGTGQRNFGGDNDLATQAQLNGPAAVAFDPAGDLLIADSGNNRVRGVYGSPGIITTLAGNATEEFAGDAGPASSASLYGPYAVTFDPAGNVWISDMFHNRVREIRGSLLSINYPPMRVGKLSAPVAGMLYNAGNGPLTLTAPGLTQAALDPTTTTCAQAPLAPSVFCKMGVEFAPTQVGQNITGAVQWTSDAPNVTPVDALNGQVLSVEPTSVTLAAAANPGLLGQPVNLTATVSSADTGRSGTVDFKEGSTTWCSGVRLAADGTAACQIPSLSLGSHTLIAIYSGDDNNAASQSAPYAEVIKQQPALLLSVSPNPATVTGLVTFTLSAGDGTGTPTGSVVFADGGTALATVTLDANGMASWSTRTLAVGPHSISAQYAGDSGNVAGTSNTVPAVVAQASTLTVASSSNTNPAVGSAVTFSATVVSNNGPTPTGLVNFKDGATPLGSAPLGADGAATLPVNTLTPGAHSITAVYVGDTNDAGSSSSALAETVQQIGTAITLSADANPANAGAALHLTAAVSLAPGALADGTLAGTVTFRDGAMVLGTVTMNAQGQAQLTVSTLSVGSHAITAGYDGSTNYATSNSAPVAETVRETATQVTLGTASAAALAGKAVTLTATVSSGTGIPTGPVSFREGAAVLGTATLDAHGVATFATTTLSVGTHTLTAIYGGDASYQGSTSANLGQTVQLAQPTLTLSGPAGPVDAGVTVQFSSGLASPGVAPTGTLTLLDGANALGTVTISNAGTYSFSSNRLSVGNHTLFASYSGDGDNASVTSAPFPLTVQQGASSTALSASSNPLTQGGPLTLSATVTSNSPNTSGSVNFFDGTTLLGTVPLGTNGSATFSPGTLGLGNHVLTAVYAGDTNHAGSSSVAVAELVVQSSATTLLSGNNPAASGQNITLTAQVSGANGGTPTGTATFRDNGNVLAAVPLQGAGVASFTTGALAVGTHTITVSYSGDTSFATSGAQLVQTVVNANTQITLAAGSNPATYGQALSLSATVSSNGGAATGTVVFTDGSATVGSASLNASGLAVFTTTALLPGAHLVVANYAGDGKASASVSAPLPLVVKQTTAVALSSTSNPAQTLSSVTFTAAVSNAGAAAATGSVSFTDGNSTLGTVAVDAGGHASLTLPLMSAGVHHIAASYTGDGANFASASPAFSETVNLRPTTTTVTGSSTDAANPQQMTLIAVVKGQGPVMPGGTVTFTSGNVTLGLGTVDATGVATVTIDFEQTTKTVVAAYAGDASYAASQSAGTPITAGQAAQFTLAVDTGSMTLVTHQHATINVNVGSVKGFSDTIALGCVGLPYAATCTFSAPQLKLAPDGTATATLIVDTGNPLGAGSGTTAALAQRRGTALLCWLPAGLLLGLVRRRQLGAARRRLGSLLLLVLALTLTLGTTGCAGLSTSGTPPGTYTFKVIGTGQGSSTTQAQTVTLVVTQ